MGTRGQLLGQLVVRPPMHDVQMCTKQGTESKMTLHHTWPTPRRLKLSTMVCRSSTLVPPSILTLCHLRQNVTPHQQHHHLSDAVCQSNTDSNVSHTFDRNYSELQNSTSKSRQTRQSCGSEPCQPNAIPGFGVTYTAVLSKLVQKQGATHVTILDFTTLLARKKVSM